MKMDIGNSGSMQVKAPKPRPAAKKPGGRGALIIVGLLVVFLAVVLFVVRNNVAAGDLKVGDCFDIPNGTTVRTVQSRPCAQSHNAEVIFVGEYDGATYPISLSLDSYVKATCLPAFESYVGRGINTEPKLAVDLSNRVILTPHAAKRLWAVLGGVLREYEQRYGVLTVDRS